MDRRIVIKMEETRENPKFLSQLMKLIYNQGYSYEVLNRPKKSYGLNSYDGFLSIKVGKSAEPLKREIEKLLADSKATAHGLHVKSMDDIDLLTCVNGQIHITSKKTRDMQTGGLKEDALYYGQEFSVFLGENPAFLASDEYAKAMALMEKHDFLKINYEEQIVVSDYEFFLNRREKVDFLKDLKQLTEIFTQYNLSVDCSLTGYDPGLNVEKIIMMAGNVEQYHYCLN